MSMQREYDLSFVLLNGGNSYFETFLVDRRIPFARYDYSSKKDLLKVTNSITEYFRKLRPDIVHTHFLDANLAGLMAAWLTRVPQRIHTRHHSIYHHRYHRKGVIYDWLSNKLSTRIVAISKNVQNILIEKEHVSASKISLIHHGFDLNLYQNIDPKEVDILKSNYTLPEGQFIFGVVSRYIDWKGINYIIAAFKEFHEANADSFLILMNARGPNKGSIKKALQELPQEAYLEVPFEKDMHVAYHLFDCFIHTPIDEEVEAFGQVYIEAMAAGVPSIVTLSGIARDYIINDKNALVVPYCNVEAIVHAMDLMKKEAPIRNRLAQQAIKDVECRFSFSEMREKLIELYEHR